MMMEIAGDRPPRYDKKRHPLAIARAIQRARGTGPRATIKTPPLTVGRGPVPRHRSRNPTRAGDGPPRYGNIGTGTTCLLPKNVLITKKT